MITLSTGSFVISVLAITTVLGCGVMPPGQASSRNFTVTGFSLPISMAYSELADVRAQVPGISASRDAAQSFVSRLVMQTVFDVLEGQGRSAGLPDAIIAVILGQLSVQIRYEALECKKATVDHANPALEFISPLSRRDMVVIRFKLDDADEFYSVILKRIRYASAYTRQYSQQRLPISSVVV
ncbi:hypothetical protein KIN20_027892 [Parelaphostrongylus tenuis]|uniref:Uncharacterized protein n=1 Tax=Parelaphostrongylus tenuis TaxID=148309 RepID=A0AAD5R0M3_PARTN|nr:hypothetical protein KIN20_027892 [Parelaphostrongylus tenuis]